MDAFAVTYISHAWPFGRYINAGFHVVDTSLSVTPSFPADRARNSFLLGVELAFQIPNGIQPIRCVLECTLKRLQNTFAASAANLKLEES